MIRVYTLPKCTKCKAIIKFLQEKNLNYEERNAIEYLSELLPRGFVTVPVVEVNEEFYKIETLDQLKFILQKHSYKVD